MLTTRRYGYGDPTKALSRALIAGGLAVFVGCASEVAENQEPQDQGGAALGSSFETRTARPWYDDGGSNTGGGSVGGGGGGYGYNGNAFNATLSSAVCAPRYHTTYLLNGQAVVNERILSVAKSTGSKKGSITFKRWISGVQSLYKIHGTKNIGSSNNNRDFTVVSWMGIDTNGDSIPDQSKATVDEATSDFTGTGSGSVATSIDYDTPRLFADCSVSGINPLYIYGNGFTRNSDVPVYLDMIVESNGTSAACHLFRLMGQDYSWIDPSSAMWKIPAYEASWTPGSGYPSSSEFKFGTYGQKNPTQGGCPNNTNLADRKVGLFFGSLQGGGQPANLGSAFTYGVDQTQTTAPRVDYVCITPRAEWDANLSNLNYKNSDCDVNGSNSGSTKGDIKAKTGDVLTIVGQNFQRKNAAPLGDGKILMDLKVSVGGIEVAGQNLFSMIDRNKGDLRNGGCVGTRDANLDGIDDGGVCQRVHAYVPAIPAHKVPLMVGAAVQNSTLDQDQYGGRPAMVNGDPGDRKIKYYGGDIVVAPTPIAPPAVPIVSASVLSTTALSVTFTEVEDDDPNLCVGFVCPKKGLPVSHYDLRIAESSMLASPSNGVMSPSEFSSAVPYSGELLGYLPGQPRIVMFSSLRPDTRYCFSAKAIDNDGLLSPLNAPAGALPSDGTFCARTAPIPVDPPPCQIALSAQLDSADPQHRAILSWKEPGAVDSSYGCMSGGSVSALDLKRSLTGFTAAEFAAGGSAFLVLISESLPDPQGIKLPGEDHSFAVSGLQPNTVYYFGIRARDSVQWGSVSLPVSILTDAIVLTPTPTPTALPNGSGEFIDLSTNLPGSTNPGHTIEFLPKIGSNGKPSMMMADPTTGIRIFKVTDARNVNCRNADGTTNSCVRTEDDEPKASICLTNPGDPACWVGDGMPDMRAKDYHILRTGPNDCDQANLPASPLSTLNPDWSKVDSFAACNLPRIGTYGKAQSFAMGRINNDAEPDLLVANPGAQSTDFDPVYINSGSDLCNLSDWPGRQQDEADGIPCFRAPINLPLAAGQKQASNRTKLFDALVEIDGSGKVVEHSADLLVVMGGANSLAGTTFYSNGCRGNAVCQASDFAPVTNQVFDPAQVSLPLYCEDVAFLDLNGDNRRDMVCLRSANFTSSNIRIDGADLVFRGEPPVSGSIPRFVLDQSLGNLSVADNCNSSFASVSHIGAKDYLLMGYTLNGLSDGRGSVCKTQLYSGNGSSGFAQRDLPGLNNLLSCHNGAVSEVRESGKADVVLACGTTSDMNANVAFRGDRLFLNSGLDTYADFEQSGPKVFYPSLRPSGQPIFDQKNAANPLIFDWGNSVPGASNAVGFGDLDGDSVNDLFFGIGRSSAAGSFVDRIFKQVPTP